VTEKPDNREDEILRAAELLAAIAEDRRILANVSLELRLKLLIAAGRVSQPDRKAQRQLAKEFRRNEKNEIKAVDEEALSKTGQRIARRAPVFRTPRALPPGEAPAEAEPVAELKEARKCYVCKVRFTQVHHFYPSMCMACAEFNWEKRQQTADLTGRVAIVTGARVKIGYQASIMLLRAGAHVIATTRFPRDAATRYANEVDYESWKDRIEVYGVDLRHTPSVEAFCKHIDATHTRLDYILNNACQTVRRPVGFYGHLMEKETQPLHALSHAEKHVVQEHERLRAGNSSVLSAETTSEARAYLARARVAAIHDSAALSQIALLEEDLDRGAHLFPAGALDQDLQQVDLRDRNSWRLTLAEVSAAELLEVHLVNAVAPFILNARLKSLMARTNAGDKHIVNVSAMEGQFYRAYKTDKHPHTNMAKAALNMMTRTSAPDYRRDGIHMNSVDTGWVTDEDPAVLAERKTVEHGFHPPLDIVDGAARICDPIFSGIRTGEHVWGQFLKDYKSTDW
jgi:NAD(P)-dependent dehydrogenase (short-subunit alcohol dehydrogenase family)